MRALVRQPLVRAERACKRRALVDRIKGIYIPYWTFDAQVHCPWTAEAGTTTTCTRSTATTRASGRRGRCSKVRWEPAVRRDRPLLRRRAGARHARHRHAACLQEVEPFPTKELVPYDTAYLSGYVVEHYQVVLIDAAKQSREPMHAQLEGLCAAAGARRHAPQPADLPGVLRARPSSTSWCRSGCSPTPTARKACQVVANGYTGEIAGRYPKSGWKIAGAALLALIVVLIIAFFAQGR